MASTFVWGLFGVVGLLIGFVVMPIVVLLIRNPVRRQFVARRIIATGFSVFTRLAAVLGLISYSVEGMETCDPDSGHLIVANHPTLIDVVILISLFPQAECVVKDAIRRNPVLGVSARACNYISNAEPAGLLNECSARLKSGANLVLFPEGTRTTPGEPRRFKAGAAEVALRANARILPITIQCEPNFLAKKEPWYRTPPTPPHFDIRILKALEPRDLAAGAVGDRNARQALNTGLKQLFDDALA